MQQLKTIAMISMLIDHIAYIMLERGIGLSGDFYMIDRVMRSIGRPAFPIFCFTIVEGFQKTSDIKAYLKRLILFAVISEIPFDLAIFQTPLTWDHQNVFFTLLIGFVTIWIIENNKYSTYAIPLQMICILAGCAISYVLQTDYDYRGILLIVILYYFRYNRCLQTIAGCISLLWEAPACLAFIPLNMYNGKRGLPMKYFFYAFYPLHLLIFGIILQIGF